MSSTTRQNRKAAAFAALHAGEPFVLPNPWDAGRASPSRVSVGGALTWVAVKAMAEAATAIRDRGDFSALAARLPLDELLRSGTTKEVDDERSA